MSNLSSTKKSVRLSAESVAVIKEISQNEINYNGAINNIIERYKLVTAKSLPPLSEYERLAIAQAYNGHWVALEYIEREVDMLPWQLDQAIQYDGNVGELLDQGGTDAQEFMQRVKAWGFAEKMAVLHNAVAFWSQGNLPEYEDDELTFGEMLQKEYLDEMNITIKDLSEGAGIDLEDLKAVISNKKRVDDAMAAQLSVYFGTSTQFWLNLQANLDTPKPKIRIMDASKAGD